MTIRYPLDLGHKAENNFPYMSFDIVKFRDRNFIVDSAPSSSGVIDTYQGGDKSIKKTIHIDTIYLPLPDNLQNSYNPSWEMTDMRAINTIRDVLKTDVLSGFKMLGAEMTALAAGDMMKKLTFQTPNPKKQAIFNGIEPRQFSWQWSLIPYSKQESEVIDNIARTFTKHSLPDLGKSTDAFYDFPAEFGITFRNVKGFPILSYCVCQNVSIGYSQSNTQIMEDGRPSQITLSMSFLETDIRTKTRPGI